MRCSSTRRFWAVAVLAVLVAAQVHVSSEFDSCLWRPDAGHRNPAPGPNHGTHGHGCQMGFSGGWAILSTLPNLEAAMRALRLEAELPQALANNQQTEASAPRAPPHA